jgi:trimethylamine--corrinoid protein Co-methyltransferase
MYLPVLDQVQIEQIHTASMQILLNTGISLDHSEATAMLYDHGAKVLKDRVVFSQEIIETVLEQIPKEVLITGRDTKKTIKLLSNHCYPHNVGGVPNTYVPSTGVRRSATRNDNIQAVILMDALPHIASITPLYTPQDVPGPEMTLWMAHDTLANTTKPFRSPGVQTGAEVRALVEMFRIAAPEGQFTIGVSPVSPLTFPAGIVDAIFEVARNNQVLGPLPCPILGATAPMSIAGGLVQQNAEVLAAIILAYLIKPGLPVIYKGRLSVMDPYTGLSVWGNPEIGMISAATVQLAHHYGMPADVYGLCTNAHTPDIQNGYERAINTILPAMAGADEISGCGEMEGGLSSSLAQIVIDEEILSSIQRVRSGFEIDQASLGVLLIDRVMDSTHNFLAEKHTLKYLRQGEILKTSLASRECWSQWEKSGHLTILEKADKKANHLIDIHEVVPLDDRQLTAMRQVIASFQPDLR